MGDHQSSGMSFIWYVVLYLLDTLPIYIAAQRAGESKPWYAFIPILNAWMLVEMAGQPLWMIVLLFIPCVNLFALIYIWMKVFENNRQSQWMGLIMWIPIVNLFGAMSIPPYRS